METPQNLEVVAQRGRGNPPVVAPKTPVGTGALPLHQIQIFYTINSAGLFISPKNAKTNQKSHNYILLILKSWTS